MNEQETKSAGTPYESPFDSTYSVLTTLLPLLVNAGNVSRSEFEVLKDKMHDIDKRIAILEASKCKCHEKSTSEDR